MALTAKIKHRADASKTTSVELTESALTGGMWSVSEIALRAAMNRIGAHHLNDIYSNVSFKVVDRHGLAKKAVYPCSS